MLVLFGALLPALMFCALGGYALMQSRAQYEQRAELLTLNLATAIDHSVSVNVDKIDLALSSIVDHLEMQLATDRLDPRAANAHIRSQIAHHPELEGVRVTDARGIAVLGPGIEGQPPVDFSKREWFIAQRDHAEVGLYMSQPLVSKITGSWIL
ncbi:hypothetical protein [Piscinibacter sp.]|uniref:PDC sensor domain-containing protein n=1 Tax=Piscinibacter sp. TaxID=1903157 RepID=UPI0035594D2D